MNQPGDVIRILSPEELPDSVRSLPAGQNPLAEGVLMKHQIDWCKLINEEDLCAAEKGRRTGITYATALDDTITASSRKEAGGDDVYYVGDTKEKGLEFVGYCAHFARVMACAMAENWNGIEVFMFKDQEFDAVGNEISTRDITAYRIRFASGFQVVALSSNPANIRGLQGIVNIDEAAFHKNVQAVIDSALALLIWGGKIRIISTHNTDKSPFNQLIKDSRKGLQPFKVMTITFDDAVNNGLYERVCLVRGWEPTAEGKEAWYKKIRGSYGTNKAAMKEELDAIPREGSGVAIPSIYVEQCMHEPRPILRLALDEGFVLKGTDWREAWTIDWIRQNLNELLDKLDPEQEHVFGSDYARHCDFAVTAPGAIQQDLVRKVPFLIEMHKVPTAQQGQILWRMISCLPRFRCGAMDATGNGQTLAELTADEFGHEIIQQVTLNDAWYRDNMGTFEDAWKDRMIDVPSDADILNDVRSLEKIDGVIKLPNLKKEDTKDKTLKRHGDSAIALALMWFSSKQDVAPTEHQASGERITSHGGSLANYMRT